LQIQECVTSINEKLSELNAERAELEAYQVLDKQQRGIEYALLDRELTAARKELAQVRNYSTALRLAAGTVHIADKAQHINNKTIFACGSS
jgi:structural maintenance of chromosome 3 (chondroitin sulfate proteoglycan 6)